MDAQKPGRDIPTGELDLLRRIRRLAPRSTRTGLALGIGDDCALLRIHPGEEIAVTTDLSLAGRHFRLDWHPPEAVGHRTLARGLSDLAAMGARPVAAFLSLAVPRHLTVPPGGRRSAIKKHAPPGSWVDRFYNGLLALAATHKTPLAGGDLAESPLPLADIVLIGAVPKGRALLRSGARPGDSIYVTGRLGAAALGLHHLATLAGPKRRNAVRATDPVPEQSLHSYRPLRIPEDLEAVLQPHLYPVPRIPQGLWLQHRHLVTAALDISDGLSTDLAHICEESRVSAEIDAAALPIAPGATLEQAVHGGEDYELLFTARPAARLPRSIAGVPLSRIGHIVRRHPRRPQILLRTATGPHPLKPHGWEHFSIP